MISAARTRAENHFASLEKKKVKAISEQEEAERVINENTTRLRALRLIKEAEDRSEKTAK